MRRVLALAAISSFLACQNTEKQNSAANTKDVTVTEASVADTLTYTYDSVKVYSKTPLSTHKEVTDTAKATFKFPVFQNTKLNALIEAPALLTNNPDARKYTSYKDLANSFIKEFDDFKKDNADSPQSWFKEVDIQVLKQRKNYLGLKYSFLEYAGGAHPNSVILFKNYTVDQLKPITLSDLITEGKQDELTAIAEGIFRKNEKLGPKQSLSEGYFFDKDIFVLNDNFTIKDDGIEFFYNPYEIRAYAYGSTTLFIPYAAIKHILKPNTIVPVQ